MLRKLIDGLNALTPDVIATVFEMLGIKGAVNMHHCPVANYLKQRVRWQYLSVDSYKVIHREPNDQRWDGVENVDIDGTPLSTFVRRFDADYYPSLQVPPSEVKEVSQ